jgi:hypothetical protein
MHQAQQQAQAQVHAHAQRMHAQSQAAAAAAAAGDAAAKSAAALGPLANLARTAYPVCTPSLSCLLSPVLTVAQGAPTPAYAMAAGFQPREPAASAPPPPSLAGLGRGPLGSLPGLAAAADSASLPAIGTMSGPGGTPLPSLPLSSC